ncbi:MAG: hypothetical protein QM775_16980 [Pirellulales bacterium]
MSKASRKRRPQVAPEPAVVEPASPSVLRRLFEGRIWRTIAVVAWLAVVGYFTYRESFTGVLFFDDSTAIEQNPHIAALVDPETRWTWRSWQYAATAERDTPFAGRPVVALSFALNHWWASASSPTGIADFIGILPMHVPYLHYVNTALHVLVAALIYAVVRRTLLAPAFGQRFQTTAGVWAFVGATIWLVHPLNTETVCYVTQRTEQLISLFLLLTLYGSIRAADAAAGRNRHVWQLTSIACCVLGMLSKENMIAAPLLVLAYDRAFRFASWREAFQEALGILFRIIRHLRRAGVGHDPRAARSFRRIRPRSVSVVRLSDYAMLVHRALTSDSPSSRSSVG